MARKKKELFEELVEAEPVEVEAEPVEVEAEPVEVEDEPVEEAVVVLKQDPQPAWKYCNRCKTEMKEVSTNGFERVLKCPKCGSEKSKC